MKRNFLIMSCLMVISICSLAGCTDNSQFVPLSYTAGISEVQAIAIAENSAMAMFLVVFIS